MKLVVNKELLEIHLDEVDSNMWSLNVNHWKHLHQRKRMILPQKM